MTPHLHTSHLSSEAFQLGPVVCNFIGINLLHSSASSPGTRLLSVCGGVQQNRSLHPWMTSTTCIRSGHWSKAMSLSWSILYGVNGSCFHQGTDSFSHGAERRFKKSLRLTTNQDLRLCFFCVDIRLSRCVAAWRYCWLWTMSSPGIINLPWTLNLLKANHVSPRS